MSQVYIKCNAAEVKSCVQWEYKYAKSFSLVQYLSKCI